MHSKDSSNDTGIEGEGYFPEFERTKLERDAGEMLPASKVERPPFGRCKLSDFFLDFFELHMEEEKRLVIFDSRPYKVGQIFRMQRKLSLPVDLPKGFNQNSQIFLVFNITLENLLSQYIPLRERRLAHYVSHQLILTSHVYLSFLDKIYYSLYLPFGHTVSEQDY